MSNNHEQQGKRGSQGQEWRGCKDYFVGNLFSRGTPVPVPVYDPYSSRRSPRPPQASLWQLCIAWLRYYRIQLRWDIERAVARLLRRWT